MPRPTIKNVLDFTDVHEVVGHGRARRSSSARSSQVEVEIVVAPVLGNGFARGVPAASVWVGCGELGMLPVGSRWKHGLAVGTRLTDVVTGDGTVASLKTRTIGEWPGLKDMPFFPIDGLAHTRCFELRLEGGKHRVVMLPIVEAIRAVFGRTSDLLLQLYGGRVADEVRRFQIAPELVEENRSDPERKDGRRFVRLRFPRAPSKPEAMIAAMVLTDPLVADAFYGVNANLTSAMGWRDGREVVVDTTSPLMLGSEIAFEGRWIGRPGEEKPERRLLVTRVLSLSMEPAFHSLEVAFPSAQTDPAAPPTDARIRMSKVDVVYVRAERDPAPGGPRIEIDVPGCEVALEHGVDFRRLPDSPAEIRPQRQLMGDDEEDGKDGARGSTGGAVPGGDRRTRRVTTRDDAKIAGPDLRLQSMEHTDRALALLVSARGWKTVYRRGRPFEDVGQGFEVLVVGIAHADHGHVEVMVCDAGTWADETVKGKKRSLGLAVTLDGRGFGNRDLIDLRRLVLDRDGRFRSEEAGVAAAKVKLKVGGLVRTTTLMKDIDAYATAVADAINRLLGS